MVFSPNPVWSGGMNRRTHLTSLITILAAGVAGAGRVAAQERRDRVSDIPVGPGPYALLIQDDPTGPRGGVTPAGRRLAQLLDGMHVESLWLAGYPIDWRTGEITGPRKTTPGGHTHCSAFAAAAADRMGVYLLRPPEHGQDWLANAQEEWLNGKWQGRAIRARDAGWLRIGALYEQGSSERAIARANAGHLVVAVYFQPPDGDRQRAGHIAIVRPGDKPPGLVQAEGPDVTQAGGHNHRIASLREGFVSHKAGWRDGTIEYFRTRAQA